MVSCTTKLTAAVCSDLVRLSGCLLEKGLISQENASGLRNRNIEEANRAARLVDVVQQKVKLDSRNYVQFTSILEEDKHHYSDILRILKGAYSSLSLMQGTCTCMCIYTCRLLLNYPLIACNAILFLNIHVAPSEVESAVHTKAKNLSSLQISRGADTQPSPEKGSYAYSVWN